MCLVDRNTLATSGWEKVIGVWDLPSKQLVRKSSQNHEKNIKFLISIGSGHVASCGRDGLVNISDVHVNTGACKVTLKGHIKDALFLGMMDDGTLVSSSLDKTLRGWTIMNSGKMITKMFANLHQLVGSHTLSDIKIV
jgi:WD40 repeat protein